MKEQREPSAALTKQESLDDCYIAMDEEAQQQRPEAAAAFDECCVVGRSTTSSDDDDENGNSGIFLTSDISVETADGIHDKEGFLCICLVVFISDMSRGIFFPSLWPLVSSLGGTHVSMGYAIAAFALGEMLVFPALGVMSFRMGYTQTLLLSSSALLLGTFLYAQVPAIGRIEFLIAAQTFMGCGSGTFGVTRGFVADVTAKRNRTTYMSLVTSIQYAACTVMPIVGALLNHLFGHGDRQYVIVFGFIRLNMYTAPAYVMMVTVAITLGCLLAFFRNRRRIAVTTTTTTTDTDTDTTKEPNNKQKSRRRQAIEQAASAPSLFGFSLYTCAIAGCMLLNFSNKGSIASFETLGISFAETFFGLRASRASLIVAACGAVGVCMLLSMSRLRLLFRKNDVLVLSTGLSLLSIGIAILWLTTVDGDDNQQQMAANPSWKYGLAMLLIYGLGYPIGYASITGIFSKIIGRRPQGMLLGWFASAGALARIFFPIAAGYISHYVSMLTVFGILFGVIVAAIAAVVCCRYTLLFLSQ